MSRCPVSSWSSRASRRRSTSCAATTRCTTSRATRSERSTATAAREANVSASRRSSSEKRTSGPPALSCAAITPIVRSRTTSGTQRLVRPEPAVEIVVDGRDLAGALERAPRRRRTAGSCAVLRRQRSDCDRRERADELRAGARRPGRGAAAARSRSPARFRPRSATRAAATTGSASSARSRVSAISFWIVKPTRAETLTRITIGRQADGGYCGAPIAISGIDLDEREPDQPEHELEPAAGEREPDDREEVEAR